MRKLFIEGRSRVRIRLSRGQIDMLPKKVGLFSSVQYLGQLDAVKRQLEAGGRTVRLYKVATHEGQLLGCSTQRFRGVDAFLYIGDGAFHPLTLALNNVQPIHIYNPGAKKLTVLDRSLAVRWQKRRAIALARYSDAKTIGILVSTKPGQCRLADALALKKEIEQKGIEACILVADDLWPEGLANFPFIDCFVSTACPRMAFDDSGRIGRPIVNYEDVVRSRARPAARRRKASG